MVFFLSLGILGGLRLVAADIRVDAVCKVNTWTTNELRQNPCIVAADLQAACFGGDFHLPALQPLDQYAGPLAGQGNPCVCSSVTYSMVSACAACQSQTEVWAKWSSWSQNCTSAQTSIASYPIDIPAGIAIPAWAFQNVTITATWDIELALQVHNHGQPDITAAITSSSLPVGASPTGSSDSLSPTTSSSDDSGSGDKDNDGKSHGDSDHDNNNNNQGTSNSRSPAPIKHSNNAGAIAGGVIGGLVALSVLVLVSIFLQKRRRQRINSGARVFFDEPGEKDPRLGSIAQSPAPMVEPYVIPRSGLTSPIGVTFVPNDPSTYPPPSSANHSHSVSTGSNPNPFSLVLPQQQPAYSHPSGSAGSSSGPPPGNATQGLAYYGYLVPGYNGAAEL